MWAPELVLESHDAHKGGLPSLFLNPTTRTCRLVCFSFVFFPKLNTAERGGSREEKDKTGQDRGERGAEQGRGERGGRAEGGAGGQGRGARTAARQGSTDGDGQSQRRCAAQARNGTREHDTRQPPHGATLAPTPTTPTTRPAPQAKGEKRENGE